MTMKEYSVLHALPNNWQRVMCFGHKTYCCCQDMDKEPDWHEVIFRFVVCEYKLKEAIPEDPEETILQYIKVVEGWDCGPEFLDGQVIGVTKWKKIE